MRRDGELQLSWHVPHLPFLRLPAAFTVSWWPQGRAWSCGAGPRGQDMSLLARFLCGVELLKLLNNWCSTLVCLANPLPARSSSPRNVFCCVAPPTTVTLWPELVCHVSPALSRPCCTCRFVHLNFFGSGQRWRCWRTRRRGGTTRSPWWWTSCGPTASLAPAGFRTW